MHTATRHIAAQIARALQPYRNTSEVQKMMITGGGAFNDFLVETLKEELHKTGPMDVVVPDEQTVKFKEAIAMALMGTLRWREETNVLNSVTGATGNSVGGAMWLPPVS